jgi:hypothetical protein
MTTERNIGDPEPSPRSMIAGDVGRPLGRARVKLIDLLEEELAARLTGTLGDEPSPLAEEIAFYRAHLQEWADHAGQHVLIRGKELHGFFPTRDEALAQGFRLFGRVPFLVKQVTLDEQPKTLTGVIV